MKKLMMAIAVFGVAFSFLAVTMAQTPAPAEKKMAPAKEKVSKISGEVSAIDAQAKTIKVKAKDKEVSLMVTDKTSIAQGKEKKTLADIQSGAKVKVTFVEEGDKMIAKSIRITVEKKAAAKPAMPAPEKK